MPAIAASDLSWSVTSEDVVVIPGLGKHVRFGLSFGGADLTYPAGGIALDAKKIWAEDRILNLKVIESNVSGYVFEFDVSTQKLRILQVPALIIDTGVDIAAQPLDELGTAEEPDLVLVCEALVV